jgi:predicted CXXCH cytochrome family protein
LPRQTQTEVCFTCHKEQRSQVNRPVHHPIIEGKMSCSSCHNVHGDNPKQLVRATTNETCFTCHMEKRGPFVHNHPPVQEDCAICHQPHGTTIVALLKSRPPFLCQECHNHQSHPSQAGQLPIGRTTSTSQLGSVARGCLNCHINIHGSNSIENRATAGRFRRSSFWGDAIMKNQKTALYAALAGACGLAFAQEPTGSVSVGAGYWSGDRPRWGVYDGMHEEGAYLLLDGYFRRRDDATGTWLRLDASNLGLDTREIRAEWLRQGNMGLFLEYSRM